MRPVLLLGLFATLLAAQEGTGYIQGVVGQARLGHETFKNSTAVGLGLGGWMTDRFGLDVRGLKAPMDPAVAGGSGNRYYALASFNLNFRPGAENWWPYLAVGAGGTATATPYSGKPYASSRLNLHGGLGLQGNLATGVRASLDWKAVRTQLSPTFAMTDNLFTLGLGYTFGGRRPAPAPVPAPAPAPVPAPPPAPVPPPPPPPPPAPEAPKPVEAAKPIPRPEPIPVPRVFVLDEASLHFANSKAALDADGTAAIRKVAASLKDFPGKYALTITGYTSSQGGKAFNKALSKRRADAVAKVLIADGIPAAAITTVGAGPERPVAENRTKAGQARNRRVEIAVKAEGAKVETRRTETAVKE